MSLRELLAKPSRWLAIVLTVFMIRTLIEICCFISSATPKNGLADSNLQAEAVCPQWCRVNSAPNTNGATISVVMPATNSSAFFRLV